MALGPWLQAPKRVPGPARPGPPAAHRLPPPARGGLSFPTEPPLSGLLWADLVFVFSLGLCPDTVDEGASPPV